MAGELHLAYLSGRALYAVVLDSAGDYWSVAAGDFAGFNAALWSSYAVPMAELGPGTGQYSGDFPAAPGGVYAVDVYDRAGAAPVPADGPPVASGAIQWSGKAEIPLADMLAVPALLGVVAAAPVPLPGAFAVVLDEPLDQATQPGAFAGLYLTAMPGGSNGAPVPVPITGVYIEDPTHISVTLKAGLPVAPAAGDPIAISG